MEHPDLSDLLSEVERLREAVENDAREIVVRWSGWIEREDYRPSAENFARYLAFRRHDVRLLQGG